ncbi:MAG: ROK family protein [Chloroflexota bacterium]|nr:ROK family protein [Chloroflexota bacterium]
MSHSSAPILALDVGGTKTSVAAVQSLPSDRFVPLRPPVRFPTPRDPEAFLDAVVTAAEGALPDSSRPSAVGIGVPGPLDAVSGIVETSPNIGWRDFPIATLVSQRFGGVPVAIEDDANTGALGEAVAGAGREADPYAYLPLGTGLGAGIIVGGRIVRGAHGAAGEVGHMAVDHRTGPRCSCGRRNCVEAWCAGAGMARRARELWPSRRSSNGVPAPRDAAAVFALAKGGDPDALALVGQARHALAVGIATILAAVDPAAVTVGGSIGVAQPAFVRGAFREATRLVHATPGRAVRLCRPKLGEQSVLAGAAVLGIRASGEA